MKKINFYRSLKYSSPEYREIAPNIFLHDGNYVTSLSFEQEPAMGEGQSAADISQYPLEDILEHYCVHISDFYSELNQKSNSICYVEFAGRKIEYISSLLGIVGKRVINKDIYENGEVSTVLIIE